MTKKPTSTGRSSFAQDGYQPQQRGYMPMSKQQGKPPESNMTKQPAKVPKKS